MIESFYAKSLRRARKKATHRAYQNRTKAIKKQFADWAEINFATYFRNMRAIAVRCVEAYTQFGWSIFNLAQFLAK